MVGMDDVSSFLSNPDDLPERSEGIVDLPVGGLATPTPARTSKTPAPPSSAATPRRSS